MTACEKARPRLVAVVVTHNRLAKLRRCIAALCQTPDRDLAGVVVVDMASSDGTGQWLSELADPRLHVVRHAENIGGAGGFALGMKEALAVLDADWVVLLDDDAWPEKTALAQFHATKRDPNVAYAAAVLTPDGKVSAINRPFWNPFANARRLALAVLRGKRGYYLSERALFGQLSVAVAFATFVGFFVSQQAIDKAGCPDPRYFLYCDDLAYCETLRAVGLALIFDPNMSFRHECETFSKGQRIYDPLWKSYYGHRNGLILVRRMAGWLAWPVVAGLIAVWGARSVFYGRAARAYLRLLWIAIRDALDQNFLRDHAEILRRAAHGTGCVKKSKASPSAVTLSPVSATKAASE